MGTRGMGHVVDFLASTQTGDVKRHLEFDALLHVLHQPVVGFVNNLVDGKGGRRRVRMGGVVGGQGFGDLGQPVAQLRSGSGIQGRHGTHHASFALLNHETGVADGKEG